MPSTLLDIDAYLASLTPRLRQQFGPRLLYVGLQGSYLRGEATQHSDVDIMVVLDGLTMADLAAYRAIIQSLPAPEKSCGFICGREELAHWNPLEICHLLHTTRNVEGALRPLVPAFTPEDVRNYVKVSVGNLYHELCHRYVHRGAHRSCEALPDTYRGVFFILQNLCWLKQGRFAATKAELLTLLSGQDYAVLARAMALAHGEDFDFDECFTLLLTWCQDTLKALP